MDMMKQVFLSHLQKLFPKLLFTMESGLKTVITREGTTKLIIKMEY